MSPPTYRQLLEINEHLREMIGDIRKLAKDGYGSLAYEIVERIDDPESAKDLADHRRELDLRYIEEGLAVWRARENEYGLRAPIDVAADVICQPLPVEEPTRSVEAVRRANRVAQLLESQSEYEALVEKLSKRLGDE